MCPSTLWNGVSDYVSYILTGVSKKKCKPCLNGGKMLYCFNGIYYCFCKKTGYTGRNCERKLCKSHFISIYTKMWKKLIIRNVTDRYVWKRKYACRLLIDVQILNFFCRKWSCNNEAMSVINAWAACMEMKILFCVALWLVFIIYS